ncbi:DUF6602 domain-containing protein [Methylobacterium sp. SyP6R]|uniref:DUF6602 domain-containing protein n=1 Tax=Methylobacterium sp. SyP6R TaxID=2718876 RepID=UPI001F1D48D0|nr:DUF6602 domain-containing protein [Methylobacterium sp. SyP6R]MCF4127557.1 hypothetical protein [Methylobacterium sp. SyP6R]
MPTPADYFSFVAQDLKQKSNLIRQWYATHKPSAGANREEMLQKLLRDFLPQRYTISSGMALAATGEFSNQADIFVADGLSSNPLIDANVPVWLIESIYALVEVKTYLGPAEITDTLKKCQRFKTMPRNFVERSSQQIKDSLFIVWAYESPSLDTILKNITAAASGLSDHELPDFVIVPDKFLIVSGSYYALSNYGQAGSAHRIHLNSTGKSIDLRAYDANESTDHCLMMFFIWMLSWLDGAGPRSANMPAYLSSKHVFGSTRKGRF